MCADCKDQYSRVNEFECAKCPYFVINVIRLVGLFLLITVIVVYIVRASISSAHEKNNNLGVY